MENETKEVIKETPASGAEKVEETKVETTEQDPLKTELDKVKRKRTPVEKLLFRKKLIEEELKKEGVDVEDPESDEDEDNQPVTLGMLKKLQAQTATKTALELAEEVTNETERELLKYHLENTIRSTGNPQQDLRLAQGLVNSVKNSQIVEEIQRKPIVKSASTGSGAPAKETKPEEELSEGEMNMMRAPWNLSKQQILDARKGKDLYPAPAGINQKSI